MQETRYRQRYLDGIVNHKDLRSVFTTRARIIQTMRRFFDERGFMEVKQSSGHTYRLPCFNSYRALDFPFHTIALQPDMASALAL